MKKIIILLITILLLTGCKATYTINFGEKIEEEILIYTDNKVVESASQQQSEEFYEIIDDWERGYEYYLREIYNDTEFTGYKYTDTFEYKDYDSITQLRKCYDDFKFTKDDFITLNTSKEFLCASYYQSVESLDIKINTKYFVVESNADEKDGNTLIWHLNKANYTNKPISLKIDTTKTTKVTKENKISTKMIVSIAVFIILIVAFIITKKKR